MKYIGKYKICGLLGRGGMGRVLKVEHPVIGKISALKVLAPDEVVVALMGMQKIRRMFVNEATTLARLRHPNIVAILDYDEADGKPFYLMDYYVNNLGVMIGESFRSDVPSRKIRVEKAIDYTRQTLMGLACLHHAGIVHRDIKPHNLLLTDQDTIKICDFGLSKVRGEAFAGPPGLKVGSAGYASPEQERNPDQVDYGADLYAVGVCLYRMLTGRLPDGELASVSGGQDALDISWDHFFQRALAPEPSERYASARQMLADIERLHSDWEEKKARICLLPDKPASPGAARSSFQPRRLRRRCAKVNPRQAKKLFGTDDLWRPARYVANRFVAHGNQTVWDKTTGLMWQRGGSEFPLNWKDAHAYVDRLNKDAFAGLDNWRLPTIDELMSLLTEIPRVEDYCLEPIFDQTQKWLWSCDRRSFTAAWYVSVELGFVAWQDFSAYFYLRAVRSTKESD